jgi:hypothetical protein
MNYNINNETSKEELTKILTPYSILKGKKPKVLVICRGKTHNLVFHGSLMVDYKIENKPDIVMDIWSDSMDDYFPEKSFDVIRIEPCALINKNDPKWIQKKGKLCNIFEYNQKLWHHCNKILDLFGHIECNHILLFYCEHMYGKDYYTLSNDEQEQIISEVKLELSKLGFHNVIYKFKFNKPKLVISV